MDKQEIFKWLYLPYDLNKTSDCTQTILYFTDLTTKYNIHFHLFFTKIIQFLISKNIDLNATYHVLKDLKLFNDNYIDILTEIYNETIHTTPNKIKIDTFQKITKLCDTDTYVLPVRNPSHDSYPLPDPTYGRPLY